MSKKAKRPALVRPQSRGFQRFAPGRPWTVSAWLRGYVAIPDPIELVPGWTLIPDGPGSRESVVVSPPVPHAKVTGAVAQAPEFRLTGKVVARTRSAARDAGLATAHHAINLAALQLEVLFEDILDVQVLGPGEDVAPGVTRHPMEHVMHVSATATRPLSGDVVSPAYATWQRWESLAPSRQVVVVRAADWWRRALLVGKVDPPSGLLCAWAALEALASLADTAPSRSQHCPACQAPLVCGHCNTEIVIPGADLRRLLTETWGTLGRDDFRNTRDLRNYLIHGGTPPVPLSELATHATRMTALLLTAVRKVLLAKM